MKPQIILAMLVLPVMAGCMQPADDGGVDGDAALALVEAIVYDDQGDLRARVPDHPDHVQAAQWLQAQMDVVGWSVVVDPFSGADYQGLDHGAVASYRDACPTQDQQQLPDLQFINLYATLPGTADDDRGHVVLAAHWDAKEDADGGDGPVPGANDGASGVAVLLQLQRHIDQHAMEFSFDLTIAFFDGEDGFADCHPLAGSLWAARNRGVGAIDQLILLDMVGDPDARFIQDDTSRSSDPALVDAVWAAADGLGLGDRFTDCEGPMLDDHVPFHEEGVSVIDIIDAGHGSGFNCIDFQPYWHTVDDTPDQLSADMLADVGDLVLHILTDPGMQALLQD